MQTYQFSFALIIGIMDLDAADPSLDERPQMFTECSFFTQCRTASALCCIVGTAPDIDLSKEQIDQSIGKSVIKITS